MLAADPDALICDLAETYHVFDMWALPVPLLATLASGLRDQSRIKMKIAGLTYLPMEFVLPQIYDAMIMLFADKKARNRAKRLTDVMKPKANGEKLSGFDTAEEFDAWRDSIIKGNKHG